MGIRCPFCDDHSNHLGINLNSKFMNCFRCGAKGPATKLVANLERCTWGEAKRIMLGFLEDPSLKPKITTRPELNHCELPSNATKNFTKKHTKFLQGRKFPSKIIEDFDLYATNHIGHYKFRIIAPIYVNHQLVSFVARDVTGRASQKYLNCPNHKSLIPVKNTLYNIDSIRENAIIVEGITDVWRLGPGAVATYGTQVTDAQIHLLSGLKNAYILFDSDAEAQKRAEELGASLSSIVRSVDILTLAEGDPADLHEDTVSYLRHTIFGEPLQVGGHVKKQ